MSSSLGLGIFFKQDSSVLDTLKKHGKVSCLSRKQRKEIKKKISIFSSPKIKKIEFVGGLNIFLESNNSEVREKIKKLSKNKKTGKKKPAEFQTKPPFEKGSDQEKMETYEFQGPKEKTPPKRRWGERDYQK